MTNASIEWAKIGKCDIFKGHWLTMYSWWIEHGDGAVKREFMAVHHWESFKAEVGE